MGSTTTEHGAAEHRRRLQNTGICTGETYRWMRKHLVTDYLPAQCCYHLGEYPCVKPWNPNEYDEQELDRLRDHGIQSIRLFDESNDSLRPFGGHKLPPLNPEGLRRFVEMAHRRGIRVITYVSTGYMQFSLPFTSNTVTERVAADLTEKSRAGRRYQGPDGMSEGGEVPER